MPVEVRYRLLRSGCRRRLRAFRPTGGPWPRGCGSVRRCAGAELSCQGLSGASSGVVGRGHVAEPVGVGPEPSAQWPGRRRGELVDLVRSHPQKPGVGVGADSISAAGPTVVLLRRSRPGAGLAERDVVLEHADQQPIRVVEQDDSVPCEERGGLPRECFGKRSGGPRNGPGPVPVSSRGGRARCVGRGAPATPASYINHSDNLGSCRHLEAVARVEAAVEAVGGGVVA